MTVPNRYNGGGPIAGVIIEGQSDGAGGVVAPAGGSNAAPSYTKPAQNTPTSTKFTLVAATAQTLFAADPTANGCRLLNWTAAIIYLTDGVTGTPASGAPSDYIPAAASGVPGQYESPYAPVLGKRAVGASAGDITVIVW